MGTVQARADGPFARVNYDVLISNAMQKARPIGGGGGVREVTQDADQTSSGRRKDGRSKSIILKTFIRPAS
eukprot:scaffold42519_cov139-Skeletonema_dohrnii-CCMP3373.AAC.7